MLVYNNKEDLLCGWCLPDPNNILSGLKYPHKFKYKFVWLLVKDHFCLAVELCESLEQWFKRSVYYIYKQGSCYQLLKCSHHWWDPVHSMEEWMFWTKKLCWSLPSFKTRLWYATPKSEKFIKGSHKTVFSAPFLLF